MKLGGTENYIHSTYKHVLIHSFPQIGFYEGGARKGPINPPERQEPIRSFLSLRAQTTLLGSPPSRLGSRRPTRALFISSPIFQPLLGAERELPVQLLAGVLAMYKVAEAATNTALSRVETAAGFAKVGYGAELTVYRSRGVPAAVELVAGLLGRLFVLEASVDVSDQILRNIISSAMNFVYCRREQIPGPGRKGEGGRGKQARRAS